MYYFLIMMCTAVFLCTAHIAALGQAQNNQNLILIINMTNESTLPRHFRTVKDPFTNNSNLPESSLAPLRKGFDTLNLSGSGQFSDLSFNVIQKRLNNPINLYVVDLRQESHGFLNGAAVSWYASPGNWSNLKKSTDEIEQIEKALLQNVLNQKRIVVHKVEKKDMHGMVLAEVSDIPFEITSVSTEKDLMQKKGAKYIRIPVMDHVKPTDYAVDVFLNLVRSLPQNSWIHIHCSAGVGRTTTFMVMYDMLKNANFVSFDDILKRQMLIGGSDLEKKKTEGTWKQPFAEDRLLFLKNFYEYCKLNPRGEQSWKQYTDSTNRLLH